jgi:hypothetical protein
LSATAVIIGIFDKLKFKVNYIPANQINVHCQIAAAGLPQLKNLFLTSGTLFTPAICHIGKKNY